MQNISINGTGKIGSGDYNKVNIDGTASCDGELRCQDLNVDGMFKIEGSLEAEKIDVDGKISVIGNAHVGELSCDGMLKIDGNVRAGSIDTDGMLTVTGNIDAAYVKCDGMINVPHGAVSADKVKVEGCIFAKEIVGDELSINMAKLGIFSHIFTKNSPKLEIVEGTKVTLIGVKAQSVAGEDVTIGARCVIDRVHCTGKLIVDNSAQIGEITGRNISI